MSQRIDMIGKKYGRLTILNLHHKDKNSRLFYLCRCDCGDEKIINGERIRKGKTKSCGCYNREITKSRSIKHNMRYTKIYNVWRNIKERCISNNKDYGGRGIKVCDEWLNNFKAFYEWSIKNGYIEKIENGKNIISLDRIDVNGNYEPSNCRWVTNDIQCNNKRNNLFVNYKDTKYTVSQLSKKFNIKYEKLRKAYHKGTIKKLLPADEEV